MKSFFEIYESIILEAMTLEEVYEKNYSKEIKDLQLFKSLNDIDPTSSPDKKGKYLDWLIRKAYKANNNLLEDAANIKEDLSIFDKNYRHINKQITQIKDQYELSQLVEAFRKKKESGEIDSSRSEIKAGAEKIYDNGQWLIVYPKTKEAAQFYGANTRWCTAADNMNRFDYYNEQGPLYIIINKEDPKEKYQFHFETKQYMNSEDRYIKEEYKNIPADVMNKLIEKFKQSKTYSDASLLDFFDKLPKRYLEENFLKQYEDILSHCDIEVAIDRKNLKRIKELIENEKVDVNTKITKDNFYLNLLGYTFYKFQWNGALPIDIIKYLVEHGADINHIIDKSAIYNLTYFLIYHKNIPLIKYFLDKGLNINDMKVETFSSIVAWGGYKLLEFLINSGLNVKQYNNDQLVDNVLSVKNEDDKLQKIKLLYKAGLIFSDIEDLHLQPKTVTDLILSLSNNKNILDTKGGVINKIKDIISHKHMPQKLKDKELTKIITDCYNNLDLVKYLVKNGADLHAKKDHVMLLASINNNLDVVKYCLENKADIHAVNDAALRYSVMNGKVDMMKFLIENGANVNAQNGNALYRAASYKGSLIMTKYLVEHGADINLSIKHFRYNPDHLRSNTVSKYLREELAKLQ